MNRKEIEEQAGKIKWWHSIELPCDDGGVFVTPGTVDHCSEGLATQRFGVPHSLDEKTVLDIGAWDGYFSFLAENRGAKYTMAIDPLQGCSHIDQGTDGFELAKKALQSKVVFQQMSLAEFAKEYFHTRWDVVFYFGVLYHVSSPLDELRHLSAMTKEVALIETAVSPDFVFKGDPIPSWQYLPGHEGDPTNYWYPSLRGLEVALLDVGFTSMEVVYVLDGGSRATVRALKNPAV